MKKALAWTVLCVVTLAALPTRCQELRPSSDLAAQNETKVCQSVEIRNNLSSFSRLAGCRVVEGFVQILLFDAGEEFDNSNITFPELTEITGYLLLYRVNGLRSLAQLFPNLAVIRGNPLIFNYALVIFEMTSLQEIGLYSLTDIVHGSVRIEKNPSLCFVNTIDWELIAKEGENNFIKNNKLDDECPICPGGEVANSDIIVVPCPRSRRELGGRHLCWNLEHCQKVCESCKNSTCNERGECCDPSCLGGCSGPNRDVCTVCRNLSLGDSPDKKCIKKCPPHMFEYQNRRCITEADCHDLPRPMELEQPSAENPYKPFMDSCLLECPAGYTEKTLSNSRLTCELCKGRCRKECPSASVDSISSAAQLKGCTHIKGSLEIQVRGGRNIVKELEDSLSMIEEIDGYLKIVRSFPLISLNFLKNLRLIRGQTLESNKYAFAVLDNQNLQELWDWKSYTNRTFSILNGKLFFHFNPKLCYYKIEQLRNVANLPEFTDLEVAQNSNGDKVACNVTVFSVNVTVKSKVVVLKWPAFRMEDQRSLLGYVVYVLEAPYRNVTLFDGRDACGGDGWRVDDVVPQGADNPSAHHILTHLTPYTQYAFYVKTYTIATERSGAQSNISYFRTSPDVPSIPVNLKAQALSSDSIILSWQPPMSPNGNVTHYIVTGNWERYRPEDYHQKNFCKHSRQAIVPQQETTASKVVPNATCSCEAKDVKPRIRIKAENVRVSEINFEDELHNYVYVKASQNIRRKRGIGENEPVGGHHFYPDTQPVPDQSNFAAEVKNVTEFGVWHTFQFKIWMNTSFEITNLSHFARYTIAVQACRERESKNESLGNCSQKEYATINTLSREGADDISSLQVVTHISNQSLGLAELKWGEPQHPNGLVLTYQIEYKRLDIENYKPIVECVTRNQFVSMGNKHELKNLPAGNYSLRVMATSLSGEGTYSEYSYFYIKEPSSGSPLEIFGGVVVTVLVIVAIGACCIVKRKPAVPNMKIIASVNPEYVSTVYVPDDWEVPRKKIELLRELGQGSFGMVYEGIARDIVKGKAEIRCAIKTVNEHATDRERIEFLNEASVMKAFDTTHVVRLLGVVSQGQPTLVVMELMANGDLKSYLRSHRPDAGAYDPSPSRQPPTLKCILQMAIEIADGMAYLAAKKFVHRDLAARNCMVAEDLTVKIGDFGMTRDIYETDYYRKGTKGLLPVRWMAPESLKDGVFTSHSDVWSYGVVLWEMATLASQPYQGLSNDQVLRYVIDGGIMERPEKCPDKLYDLMRECWQHKPSARPSFMDLVTKLLPDSDGKFCIVSFYHSKDGVDIRETHSTGMAAQDDPATPLRLARELEDFSLSSGSDHNSDSDDGFDMGTAREETRISFSLPYSDYDRDKAGPVDQQPPAPQPPPAQGRANGYPASTRQINGASASSNGSTAQC